MNGIIWAFIGGGSAWLLGVLAMAASWATEKVTGHQGRKLAGRMLAQAHREQVTRHPDWEGQP